MYIYYDILYFYRSSLSEREKWYKYSKNCKTGYIYSSTIIVFPIY